jgi:hypothetical protein
VVGNVCAAGVSTPNLGDNANTKEVTEADGGEFDKIGLPKWIEMST